MSNRYKPWLSAAFLLVVAPLEATKATEVIDEIVVTADFRERSLREVPFSVSVLGADFVDDVSVQHFEELVNVIPNMNWSGDGHRARYFQIRGVGELEQYLGAPNPSIGFLIDDIDFSGIGTLATMFDIESVEVLRGPQGSRYGANALGGLIYVRSAAPATDYSGRMEVSVGDDNAVSVGAALGGAIGNNKIASFRLSAQQFNSDGFRDNPYLGSDDTNARDELSFRALVDVNASETFTARFAVIASNIDNGYDAFALDNSYTVLSDKPGRDTQESVGSSLRLAWVPGNNLTLTSISSFASSDINFDFDADWGNSDSWSPVTYDYVSLNRRARDTLSQEVRIGNDDWVVGLYGMQLREGVATVNQGDYYDPFYDFADSLNERLDSDYEATNIALFGQRDWSPSEYTTLSAGLRLEHRSTDYVDTTDMAASLSESMWGGELGISRTLGNGQNLYVTLSRSYKAGGFNLGPVPGGKRNFDTESMWTVEVGLKADLMAQRLQLNTSLFHNRRINQQLRTSTQLIPGDPASFVFFTDNAGDGTTVGFEADIRFFVSDRWELYSSIGLLDASLASGRRQAHAPTYTLAGGVVYRHHNGLYARLDATAKDEFYFDVSHDEKSDAYELLNARVGFENEDWKISFWVRNLLDEKYPVRGFYFGNEPPDFPNTLYIRPGDPRQLGITLERRF
ncbi:MAG TPA: TonB-dependent receptor [Woeseiaceae bacterium]|nr:TonB-dependent receptor [Woeseiaceae bacterium]